MEFANETNRKLNQKYPTLSRGVFRKAHGVDPKVKLPTNEYYNQDLFPQSVLIEIGGPENSFEEVNRSTDILAEVIAEIVKEQAK
ncbi:MAG TPA: stage II sporulation protein P [Bacillus sp. (in: firmicutes)]|nr:stage II sporulation protein P [Bacillus sp. (in: firmicutes)]